ncbi:hypothetical protein DAI22_12g220500 [Oryza sativa Japonica Group]|nr:hypothetical protein DAI22_12g220500 [Oryza sativa Japonica Group]
MLQPNMQIKAHKAQETRPEIHPHEQKQNMKLKLHSHKLHFVPQYGDSVYWTCCFFCHNDHHIVRQTSTVY